MFDKRSISILGIIANIFLAISKLAIGMMSRTTAVIADGINSLTDVFSSIVNYIGVTVSAKPADKDHPYGHERAEVVSGLMITIIVFLSGAYIIFDSIKGITYPKIPDISILTISVMAVSSIVNFVMSKLKIHYGKKYNSISLVSDGVHSRIDVLVSLSVFVSLFFIEKIMYLDSIIAFAVGAYILKEAYSLGKESINILIGVSAGEEVEDDIKKIVEDEDITVVNITTQTAGSRYSAELEISLPSKMRIEKADALIKKLEDKISKRLPDVSRVSIKISSHEFERGYYKPRWGRSISWSSGVPKYCECTSCGEKVEHKRGVPCRDLKCPKCGSRMRRHEGGDKDSKTKKI